ncbi:winged helix-turn-helix transcriptional regulator [Methanolobus psychrotolerans]|uniref:winged helix-turn-helix transcriptional regulator n=1 Tax=Methanolobus psychrotolerans TaxID=1874706 RepID=UPI001F5DAE4F|nr:winged helix-turn-helix transcriptional regulator [Methanolobus psychrotolerans]
MTIGQPERVTQNRIVFLSPGELNYRYQGDRTCRDNNSNIEAWGRGIEKINRECQEHGIQPPEYDFGMAGLMLTFQANPAHMRTTVLDQDRTTPITTPNTTPITTRDKIASLIRAKPDISQQELAEAIGMTRGGIKYHLNKMKQDGMLRHVGPARGGSWEVLK